MVNLNTNNYLKLSTCWYFFTILIFLLNFYFCYDNIKIDWMVFIMDENKEKKIEVVTGNGDLDISPVYDHIDIQKPKEENNKKEIVIPKEKK